MAIKDPHSSSGMFFVSLPQKFIISPTLLSIQVTSNISTANKAQSTPKFSPQLIKSLETRIS